MLRPVTVPPSLRVAAVLLASAILLSACGSGESDEATTPGTPATATLVLDFQPNAVHAGTFLAVRRGWDRAAGVRLRVEPPASSSDSVKLLRGGRADFAYVDIHDLAIADARRGGLVGVMALVQRPLAAVVADPAVRRPRDLEGRRAGVSGLPSDRAVLRSIVRGDGGNPDRVREVTIGFQAVPALLARRVAGATAFWNVEGVALRARRPATREFRVDDFGAPSYPELVLTTTRATLRERPQVVRDTVAALRRGYAAALADPASAVDALVRAAPGTDRATASAEFAAVRPAFLPAGRGAFGTLDSVTLRAWAAWEARFGIVRKPPDIERLFAPQVAGGR